MNRLLIIGAGRSATALVKYALACASEFRWQVTLADADLRLAQHKIKYHIKGTAVRFDATDAAAREKLIQNADVVISLLPPAFHLDIAKTCLTLKKHLITASYLSPELKALASEIQAANLIFMGEMGLDPGIDHMSAMRVIDQIKSEGGTLTSFRSYTGGLVAPESDNNPWHYKITWNPRNVVTAGQDGATYMEEGQEIFKPYNRIFKEFEWVEVVNLDEYEMYPNRDSLPYRALYGIPDIPNILRGTLRAKGYCEAWDALVTLGLTSDREITNIQELSFGGLIEFNLPEGTGSVRKRSGKMLGLADDHPVIEQLDWLGVFSRAKINVSGATPAKILEQILLKKWTPQPTDKDLVAMQHEFDYVLDGRQYNIISTMFMEGEDNENTAMAQLVGLPLGIFAKMVLQGEYNTPGLQIPVTPSVYNPVLDELETFDVFFEETFHSEAL